MDENVREILSKLSTQIDGVEHYLRQLIEIGESGKTYEENKKNIPLRAYPTVALDINVNGLRKCVREIEEKMG